MPRKPSYDQAVIPQLVHSMPELRLLTIPEAAGILRQSPRTLRRWLSEQPSRIPYVRCGHSKRIRVIDLVEFMNESMHRTNQPVGHDSGNLAAV